MQEIIDSLTAKVSAQREEIEAYKSLLERKNKALDNMKSAVVEILGEERAANYIPWRWSK